MATQPQHVTGMRCTLCGKHYAPGELAYVCPDHGNEGTLDIEYDYARIRTNISLETLAASKDWSHWRYSALLPVLPDTPAPPVSVGWTPLYPAPRLGDSDATKVWVKDDSRQPTGSLKDRASSIAVMKAREAGASVITTASTGNAAAALAGMCAAVDMPCVIFVPETAPRGKVAQLLAYGAHVYLVQGTYDDAFELCLQAAAEFGWYNRNTGYNPYMVEGKKTVAYEICEQLGWRVPDRIFVSVGDGCIISGLHKGFLDMQRLGWIDTLPKLMGVQAAGSDFLYQAWEKGVDPVTSPAIHANTVADSIASCLPRDRKKAMAAVLGTNGKFVRVFDSEILSAIPELARKTGVFAEPSGAAPLAGFRQAQAFGLMRPGEEVVLLVSGHGLKDVDSTIRACDTVAVPVEPSLASFKSVVPRF